MNQYYKKFPADFANDADTFCENQRYLREKIMVEFLPSVWADVII